MRSWGDEMREIIRRNRGEDSGEIVTTSDRRRTKTVKLWTIGYDDEREEFTRTETRVAIDELPPDAVEITKLKDTWLLDEVGAPEPDDDGNPARITAASLNLWMVNNSINEALSGRWSARMDADQIKRLAIIGFVAVVICFSVYAII